MIIEIILVSLILFVIWKTFKKPSDYPPGPWGYPIIGHIPSGSKQFLKEVKKLKKQHGDIFSWKIGFRFLVFISDFQLIKEILNSPAFSNRPDLSTLSFLDDKSLGMIATNGHHWREIRRFTLHHLRDLGMGKSKIVSIIHHEAKELVKVVEKKAGKPGPFPDALGPAVINILWQMVASKRFEFDDEELIRFRKLIDEWFQAIKSNMILDMFPQLKSVFPSNILNIISKKHVQERLTKELTIFIQKFIDEHKESLDKTNSRDYIDEYLIAMEKQKPDTDSIYSDEDLVGCVADLFSAGLETTTTTILWSVVYLCNFPQVQNRLHKEIDDVIPNGHLVTMEDKQRLPYVEAFINEVLRFSSFVCVGVPRTTTQDFKIRNYVIPKDSMVFTTAEAIHFDRNYFDSPKEFRPERFINQEGKFEVPKNGLFPFGVGKRQCLGESLARMELFIFLTTLMQRFAFSAPPHKEVDMTPEDIPLFNAPNAHQHILITIRK